MECTIQFYHNKILHIFFNEILEEELYQAFQGSLESAPVGSGMEFLVQSTQLEIQTLSLCIYGWNIFVSIYDVPAYFQWGHWVPL